MEIKELVCKLIDKNKIKKETISNLIKKTDAKDDCDISKYEAVNRFISDFLDDLHLIKNTINNGK